MNDGNYDCPRYCSSKPFRLDPAMPKSVMPKSLKIAFDVLLIVIPLAIVIYFSTSPDAFNAFLDWMMRTF
jgi:hypothetical protein